MTSGIYRLEFGDETYIGKSVDIERRWKEHYKSLVSGKSSKKLQDAYYRHGVPLGRVLIECHADHIDLMETVMISKYTPSLNSASTTYVSFSDAELLLANPKLLKYSTAEHIRGLAWSESHLN